MNDPNFVAVVSARLDPVLAPRGFPYAADGNGVSGPGEAAAYNRGSVLFHCDGPGAVDEVMARYPGWSDRLRASYGPQEILCLDLWVQQEHGSRSWSFEVFEDDVAEAAGTDARERLARSSTGPLEEWVDQLAVMLDRYFTDLEAGRTRPDAPTTDGGPTPG
jgi:hypothetical protein